MSLRTSISYPASLCWATMRHTVASEQRIVDFLNGLEPKGGMRFT